MSIQKAIDLCLCMLNFVVLCTVYRVIPPKMRFGAFFPVHHHKIFFFLLNLFTRLQIRSKVPQGSLSRSESSLCQRIFGPSAVIIVIFTQHLFYARYQDQQEPVCQFWTSSSTYSPVTPKARAITAQDVVVPTSAFFWSFRCVCTRFCLSSSGLRC